jgi:PAS domain S-box-containing protein
VRSNHLAAAGALGLVAATVLMALGLFADGSALQRVTMQEVSLAAAVLLLSCIALAAARAGTVRAVHEARRRSAVLDEVGEEIAWECDAEGRFTYASAQCLSSMGYRAEEVPSLSLFDVLHPDEHDSARWLLASGQGWRRRAFQCLAKDGTALWLRSTATPVQGRNGRVLGLSGASHVMEGSPAGELAETATRLAILRVIHGDAVIPAFQPIVALGERRMVGVEALSRFTIPDDRRGPQDWFTDAADVGLALELELHAVRLALQAAHSLPGHCYVSVNASPQTLASPALAALLGRSGMPLTRLVLELTEHSSVEDYDELRSALAPLREQGLRLAVDDAGAGYASFRHILALAADVIKLDRTLVYGIDADPARRALAAAVVRFAHDMGSIVIAEGIETDPELSALEQLGVDSAQGYLLGRPTTSPRDWLAWSAAALWPQAHQDPATEERREGSSGGEVSRVYPRHLPPGPLLAPAHRTAVQVGRQEGAPRGPAQRLIPCDDPVRPGGRPRDRGDGETAERPLVDAFTGPVGDARPPVHHSQRAEPVVDLDAGPPLQAVAPQEAVEEVPRLPRPRQVDDQFLEQVSGVDVARTGEAVSRGADDR